MRRGSKAYGCFLDASKAFDLVDHGILFKFSNLLVFQLQFFVFSLVGTVVNRCVFSGILVCLIHFSFLMVFVKVVCCLLDCLLQKFIRLASLGGGPQAHVHMEGMKCRVLYLNVLGMNALFCEPKATPAPYP